MTDEALASAPRLSDEDAIDIWGVIIRAVGVTNMRLYEALRHAFSLNPAEVDTLVVLGGTPGHRSPMVALARSASFTSGGYTKIADRLARRGLVTRIAGADDRRVILLELTPEGIDLAAQVRCLIADINRRNVIEVLGEKRSRDVAEAMSILRAANDPR